MRERSDDRWSLPGGWADPLDTPSRAVEREVVEETGYGARAVKLVGCWDRDAQGHLPKLPFSIYKLFFLCEPTGEVRPPDALETLEIGWFGLDELPELSAGRVSARGSSAGSSAHHRDPFAAHRVRLRRTDSAPAGLACCAAATTVSTGLRRRPPRNPQPSQPAPSNPTAPIAAMPTPSVATAVMPAMTNGPTPLPASENTRQTPRNTGR